MLIIENSTYRLALVFCFNRLLDNVYVYGVAEHNITYTRGEFSSVSYAVK